MGSVTPLSVYGAFRPDYSSAESGYGLPYTSFRYGPLKHVVGGHPLAYGAEGAGGDDPAQIPVEVGSRRMKFADAQLGYGVSQCTARVAGDYVTAPSPSVCAVGVQ